jgi:hypothetical protein
VTCFLPVSNQQLTTVLDPASQCLQVFADPGRVPAVGAADVAGLERAEVEVGVRDADPQLRSRTEGSFVAPPVQLGEITINDRRAPDRHVAHPSPTA